MGRFTIRKSIALGLLWLGYSAVSSAADVAEKLTQYSCQHLFFQFVEIRPGIKDGVPYFSVPTVWNAKGADSQSRAVYERLSLSERGVLEAYQRDSHSLNQALRTIPFEQVDPSLKAHIRVLDKAIEDAGPLPRNLVLYRQEVRVGDNFAKPGDQVEMKQFVSTIIHNRNKDFVFLTDYMRDSFVSVKEANPGQPITFITYKIVIKGQVKGFYLGYRSPMPGQFEMLLERNVKFKVISSKERKAGNVNWVEQEIEI